MSFQPGRMGLAEGLALAFLVTMPTLFQSTPAFLAETAGSISWLVPLLGGLVNGMLLGLQLYVTKHQQSDLLSASEKLLGKYAAYAIGMFFLFVLFTTACLWTRQFAENTLLTALPAAEFQQVVMWYALAAMLLVHMGIETTSRSAYIILPIALIGFALIFAGLASEIKPLYIFPWQGNGLASLFTPIVFFAGSTVTVTLLILMSRAFQNTKTLKKAILIGFGGGIILRSLVNLVYIMIFGTTVAAEKTLPFYELARLIYINKYVQRIEALFILLWVIIGVLGIAACLYGSLYIIAKLFHLQTIRPLIIPAAIIMTQVSSLLPDASTVAQAGITLASNIFLPGSILITAILGAAALIKGRKKQCDAV